MASGSVVKLTDLTAGSDSIFRRLRRSSTAARRASVATGVEVGALAAHAVGSKRRTPSISASETWTSAERVEFRDLICSPRLVRASVVMADAKDTADDKLVAALEPVVEASAGLLSADEEVVLSAMRGLLELLSDAYRKEMRLGRDVAGLDLIGSRLLPHFDRACQSGGPELLQSVFAVVGALYRHLVSDCDLSFRLSSVFNQLLELSDADFAADGIALATARLLIDIVFDPDPRIKSWCVACAVNFAMHRARSGYQTGRTPGR